jgi:hypothetical protein
MNNLELTLSRTENTLSLISVVPGLGSAAGVMKVAGGIVQTISAIFAAVIAMSLLMASRGNSDLLRHSWVHIKNGVGNIVAGSIEAIPVFGSSLFFGRLFLAKYRIFHSPSTPEQRKMTPDLDSQIRKVALKRGLDGNIPQELTEETYNHLRLKAHVLTFWSTQFTKFMTYPSLSGKEFDEPTDWKRENVEMLVQLPTQS